MAISPDGTTIATASRAGVVLWDVATRTQITTLEHEVIAFSVAFSPDGTTLASGTLTYTAGFYDSNVWLWDVSSRQIMTVLEGYTGVAQAVAFSPDGNVLASGGGALPSPGNLDGGPGTLKLWNVDTGQELATHEETDDRITSIAFCPIRYKKILASASQKGKVKLWSYATQRYGIGHHEIATLEHDSSVESIAFSPDCETLASAEREGRVNLWDVDSRKRTRVLRSGNAHVPTVAYSHDGLLIAAAAADDGEKYGHGYPSLRNAIKLWDVTTGSNIATLRHMDQSRGHSQNTGSLVFSPVDDILFSGSRSWPGTVILWDVSESLEGPSRPTTFSLSLDGSIAAGDQGATTLDVAFGSVVAIQLFGNDIRGVNGVSARFEYDAAQVGYDGFDPGSLLPNAQVLAVPASNPTAIDISVVSFGGQATVDSGMVGSVRFLTTDDFSGTTLRLVRAEVGRGDQRESISPTNIAVTLRLAQLTPDFNGDGRVDFGDFVAFGMRFGASRGDERYEAKYDLDEDGTIGFGDFLIFGREFGT